MGSTTAKSFIWSFLEQGGSKAIALVVQIVLARLLAPEAFGLLAIMLVLVDVAYAIAQSGLGAALIQRKDADDLSCTTAFWLSLALAIVLYAMIFAAAPVIAVFYGMPDLAPCLQVIALAVPFHAVNSIQRSILQKNMDFKSIFVSNTAAVAISGVAGVGAALAGLGVWALVIQAVSQVVVACTIMAFQVPWRPSFAFEASRAKELFSYGWKICATSILNVVYSGVSELILGKACSAGDLGLYSQGRKWPNAGINVAGNALQNVMFPAFAAMQGDMGRLQAAIRKALAVGNFVIIPLSLLAVATAEPVVAILLGKKWLPCVPVFQMTCAANCVLMLQLVNLRAYMALGDSGLYLRLQVVKVLASCAAIWSVAVATGDIYWTALVTAACSVLCVLLVDMRPAARVHGVSRVTQVKSFMPVLAVGLVAMGASWVLLFAGLPYGLLFAAQVVVFAAVYLSVAHLLKVEGESECIEAFKGLLASRG